MPNTIEKRTTKVFLVDDHALVREHLAALLHAEADLTVCGEAADVATARALISQREPDLVILDISLKRSDGLELLKELKDARPELPVLVLSMHDEMLYAERALQAGARGYITKEDASVNVLGAIRQVLAGQVFLSQRMADRRRQKRTGASLPLALLLGLWTLGSGLWASPATAAAPTGTIQDVQHVVILMQENRSFDHYFGSLRGVRGFGDPNALVFPNGSNSLCQPWAGSSVLPYHVSEQCLQDVSHNETSILSAWDGGKWDQWIPAKGLRTMQYYSRADLPFYYALADAFTICDEYHASFLGPTYPNRLYLMSGTIDPNGAKGGPVNDNDLPPGGLRWTTYPERLLAAGVDWRIYQQTDDYYYFNMLAYFTNYWGRPPGDPLHDRIALVTNLYTAFRSDVSNNTLPKVSWILPPWTYSEHPSFSPANGEWLVKQLLDSLASNPAVYNSTVFILVYDEDGGFFDHVASPVPPPGTPDEFVNGQPTGLGVRVPAIIVSPWSRGGYVCSQIFDHTSVIRFLETWTGVQEPNISAWRRKVCGDLTSAFDFTNPNTNYPSLPDVSPVTCPSGIGIYPPDPQTMPVQETGTNLTRLRPYGPNAFSLVDCGAAQVGIALTNAGSASAHFMIFANAFRADGPWQYDVDAHASLTAYFNVAPSGGRYDLTCYGPHRFHRRFTGNIDNNCDQLDVTASVDPSTAGVTLAMRNSSPAPVTFTVTNLFQTGAARTYTVPPGNTATDVFLTASDHSTGYSLVAAVRGDGSFLRTFTGDSDAIAPPAGTNGPPAITNLPPVVTNLTARVSGPNFIVTYPVGASGYTLECSTNLAPNSWLPVTTPPASFGSNIYVTLPITAKRMFFRLRP